MIVAKSAVSEISQRMSTSSEAIPPPASGSGARRVQITTDVAVGSPEATPSVNGSAEMSASGIGIFDSVDFEVEHAVTTMVAPRARNALRDIGKRGEAATEQV